MASMHTPRPVGVQQEAVPSPIVGRIDATPNDLHSALEKWLSYLSQLKKSDKTIDAYRQVVHAAAREHGWTSASELTFEAVTNYLGSKVREGAWRTGTYNRNLTCFRSFTKWLTKTGRFDKDPLALSANATQTDAGPSSRAATTEEARRLIQVALAKVASDRRSAGDRPVRYAMLFLAGLRWQEPGLLEWGDIRLDDDVPHIHWRPQINKNRREQWVAICQELVEILKEHRDGVPHAPTDPIFPRMLNRDVWSEDKKRALIATVDKYGMPFTPRSARQWFDTTLTDAGAPDRMVRKLMRHAVDTPDRYYKPDLAQQAASLVNLPSIWRPSGNVDNSLPLQNPSRSDLTRSREAGNIKEPVGGLTSPKNSIVPGPLSHTDWPLAFGEGSGAFEVTTTLPWFDMSAFSAGRVYDGSPKRNAEGRTRTADLSVMNAPL